MVDKDRVDGSAKNIGGKVKEGIGNVTGDSKMQTEGKADQAPHPRPLRPAKLIEVPGMEVDDNAPTRESCGEKEERITQEAHSVPRHGEIDDPGSAPEQQVGELHAVLEGENHVAEIDSGNVADVAVIGRVEMRHLKRSRELRAEHQLGGERHPVGRRRKRADNKQAGPTGSSLRSFLFLHVAQPQN